MLTDKIITNKTYLYAGVYHKVKKIQKSKNKVILQNMKDGSEFDIPLAGAEILLSRTYTIGEVAKITERRADTIRKYERNGLIPKPTSVGDDYPSYKNWRFYTLSDVHEILNFFSNRTPGRPVKSDTKLTPPTGTQKNIVAGKLQTLNQKVKMTTRSK